MQGYLGRYSKSLMARTMSVSRSGFNKWLARPVSANSKRKADYTQRVKATFEAFEASYGAPRITEELNALGFPCSKNYIAKIMSEQGIRARNGKGFKYTRHSLMKNGPVISPIFGWKTDGYILPL